MYACILLLLLCTENLASPQLNAVFDYEMQFSSFSLKDENSITANVKGQNLSSQRSFSFSVRYSLLGKQITLLWNVDKAKDNISFKIRISVTQRTEISFIGFGFSDRGEQYNADVILFSWEAGNDVDVIDSFTDVFGVLHRDIHNDYVIEHVQSLIQNNKRFVEIIFSRALDTHDSQDYKIEWGTTHIFILFGEGQPYFHQSLNFDEDNFVGGPLSLLRSEIIPPVVPSNALQKDFTLHKVNIPAVPTTYWCHTLELTVSGKFHSIKYEPLVTPGNEAVVHHIELYHCEVPRDKPLPSYSGLCNDKPAHLSACSKVIAAWAMGAGPLIYPAEAGVPIGGPKWSPHLMLEVHYNNPQRISGLVDSSGIKYYLTTNLRQYDVGILEVGVTYSPNLVIPPGEEQFELSGICLPNCTSYGLPVGGIRVFASQLHAHLSGMAIQTKHFRDGEELPPIDKDPHFTMSFQDIRLLPEDVIILPGDTLVTTCQYNTQNRRNVTLGGYGIMDEMCVNYLHYYPKASLEVCKSTLSEKVLNYFFDTIIGGDQLNDSEMTIEDKFSTVTWTKRTSQLWQRIVRAGPVEEECLQSNGISLPGKWEDIDGVPPEDTNDSPGN